MGVIDLISAALLLCSQSPVPTHLRIRHRQGLDLLGGRGLLPLLNFPDYLRLHLRAVAALRNKTARRARGSRDHVRNTPVHKRSA